MNVLEATAEGDVVLRPSYSVGHWEIWVASDIGLLVTRHYLAPHESPRDASLTLDRLVPWTELGDLNVTLLVDSDPSRGFANTLKATILGQQLESTLGRDATDESGLFPFVRACLRYQREASRVAPSMLTGMLTES